MQLFNDISSFQCLNVLVQHGSSTDYVDGRQKTATKAKSNYHKKHSSSSHNTLMSKSSSGSSDTEPFYLHPPSIRGDGIYTQQSRQCTPPDVYGIPNGNDGLYINPMRNGILTPPSPNGSVSGESFYLHHPQEVIYNRVKDLFDSDSGGSQKESSNCSSNGDTNGSPTNVGPVGSPNAMTVQVEVHSSSSGAGSGSEESLSVSSGSDELLKSSATRSLQISNGSSPNSVDLLNNNCNTSSNDSCNNIQIEQHDYEDIYLVREEARLATKAKYSTGRSRSRDSGSHSRSASASSSHSNDVIVHYNGSNVSSRRS